MRILLATDGSDYSEAAVTEFARRPFAPGTEVRVISVFELPSFPITVPWAGVDLDDQIQQNATAAVEKAAEKLRTTEESSKVIVTTKILSGSPKRVILEEAEAFGADLIVVGSHGHGAWEGFMLGSVSQSVALHAHCSVEIVRSRTVGPSES